MQLQRRGIGAQVALQLHSVLAVIIEDERVVISDDVIRMSFEKVHLLLQFLRIGPVVVGFAVGDVTTARFAKQARDASSALAVLIDLLIEGPNDRRMPLGVVRNDARGSVCGGVVVDQDFVPEIGLL